MSGKLEKLPDMPDDQGRPFVYLAGPDVFFPDAPERAAKMKEVLAARGMTGWFPLDSELDPAKYSHPKEFGLAIGASCEALMRRADIVIANIQPWRGPEADDGTSYEIGFMAALGKLIVLHTNDTRSFAQRLIGDIYRGEVYRDGAVLRGKPDRMMVEEFDGFADNLMLVNAAVKAAERAVGEKVDPAAVVHHSFEAAADFAKTLWERTKAEQE
jgi:nucleoside 2-deoxyribosyltransferase